MGSRQKPSNRGVAVSHAQAVSQKTRKQSASKNKKAAAASRSATKGRAKASVKDTKKAAAAKSSNKRSAMPNKTAKTVAKAAGSKTSASKAPVAKAAAKTAVTKPSVNKPVVAAKPAVAAPKAAVKPAVPPRVEEKKPLTQRQGFKTNEFVVYPAHGVGQILAIEEQEIAGAKLELFVINFIKDKMTLRVPTAKVANVGMRKLSDPVLVKKALETLKGRARVKRTMWSRRAQEYEAKINSGDIVAIAEVVRDLYRSESQPEQSYSERQLYEAALDRLSREIAVVQHVTETEAIKEIESQLAKSPRRGAKTEGDAVAEGDAEGDDADAESDDAAVEDEAA
jgi:CarD family transcriptional regulator, regulator of rRNA transcription